MGTGGKNLRIAKQNEGRNAFGEARLKSEKRDVGADPSRIAESEGKRSLGTVHGSPVIS